MTTSGSGVLILLSGGLDSSALLPYYHGLNMEMRCLHIDFGQESRQAELKAAQFISLFYQVSLSIVSVLGNPRGFGKGYIPGRNLFLLSTALMHFPFKTGLIAMGLHKGAEYPDTDKRFREGVQNLFDSYSKGNILIDTPFETFSKLNVFEYILSENMPWNQTYSCELGLPQPCGKCASCNDLNSLIDYASKNQNH